MRSKDRPFSKPANRYQLRLLEVSTEAAQPLWDRSGAARRCALRSAILSRASAEPLASRCTQH